MRSPSLDDYLALIGDDLKDARRTENKGPLPTFGQWRYRSLFLPAALALRWLLELARTGYGWAHREAHDEYERRRFWRLPIPPELATWRRESHGSPPRRRGRKHAELFYLRAWEHWRALQAHYDKGPDEAAELVRSCAHLGAKRMRQVLTLGPEVAAADRGNHLPELFSRFSRDKTQPRQSP